jgi:hypothetical protein
MAFTAFVLTKELVKVAPQGNHLPFNAGGSEYRDGCGGWTCTTTGRFMRPVHRYLCYATEVAPREVLAPSSLPLQGSACAISAIEANWYARPELNWHA